MGLETIIAVVVAVVSAATTAYQVIQAKKMRQKALAAADARKGFELVTEGETGYVPIVYGRALVGGKRVWHATSSSFTSAATNGDKTFMTGYSGAGAFVYNYSFWGKILDKIDYYGSVPASASVGALASGYLNTSMNGSRNEFMFYQQAICVGPIGRVIDVVVDSRYLDDPSLGSFGKIEKTPSEKEHRGVKAALRLDYHYIGGEGCAVISANYGERQKATFEEFAYLSGIFRLDRDNPQFAGAPPVQSIIEGRLVRTVTGGVISSTVRYKENPAGYIYSNNPAWCLLDYLLDPIWGRGLALNEVDLDSFEEAAAVCDQIVMTDAHVGGKCWRPTDGLTNVTRRDIPLYECNVMLDPEKPYRENIETLLSTMGDARLIWSGGVYKLSLQYPATNEAIDLAGTLTDDELLHDASISVEWPNADTKYNHVTVKFHNEFEGFAEDSVSWPPKYDATYTIGIGAKKYGTGIGSWDDANTGGRLRNAYAVWEGNGDTANLLYKFYVNADQAGTYTLTYSADNSMTITVNGPGVAYSGTHATKQTVKTDSITLSEGIYTVTITATNTDPGNKDGDYKGAAAKIDNGTTILWTTRSASYDDFVEVVEDSTVYETMLAEDNGFRLETSIFAEGITDPYHAKAKAEELCRTSRLATKMVLPYIIRDKFYEPGDFVKVESSALELGLMSDLYVRVDGTKVTREDQCEVEVQRFDWSMLAWNVADDVYIAAPDVMGYFLPQPEFIEYSAPDDTSTDDSSGILTCALVSHPSVVGYAWYVHRAGIDPTEPDGRPIFTEISRTSEPTLNMGRIEAASAFFGVKTFSSSGKMSKMTTTDITEAIVLVHMWLKQVRMYSSSNVFEANDEPILFNTDIYYIPNRTITWFIDDVLQAGYNQTYFYLQKFTDTNQKAVRVSVLDLDSGKTFEDVIDVGYVAPSPSSEATDTWYMRQYAPPSTPTDDPPTGWEHQIPTGEATLWATSTPRDSEGSQTGPWSTPQRLTTFNLRGAYDPDETYYKYDVVTFKGGTYMCMVDGTTGIEPSGTDQNNANWNVVSSGTTDGPAADPGDPVTTLSISVPGGFSGINLRSLADAAGFDSSLPHEITYTLAGDLYGIPGPANGGNGGAAIDTGTWPAGSIVDLVVVIPTGIKVAGGGGGGGQAGITPGNGGNGGHAILMQHDLEVQNSGTIQGGSGGGGGGQHSGFPTSTYVYGLHGGGGNGGAPFGKGGTTAPIDGRVIFRPEYSNGEDATATAVFFDGLATSNVVGTNEYYSGAGGYGGLNAANGTGGAAYLVEENNVDVTSEWSTRGWQQPRTSLGGIAGNAIKQNGYTLTLSPSGTIVGANA